MHQRREENVQWEMMTGHPDDGCVTKAARKSYFRVWKKYVFLARGPLAMLGVLFLNNQLSQILFFIFIRHTPE